MAGAMAVAGIASPAQAGLYSGTWPVTITHSQFNNRTDCLTLDDNASNGWRHSGSALLMIGSSRYSGSFQLINHTIVATITAQGYSQNAALMFIASAGRGNIGKGVFEEVYGGSNFDSGALAFGMKSGC
jgi:hypothetical protein